MKEHRPWGHYEILNNSHNYQLKLLTINPSESTSLQRHYNRAEHWIVLSGTATVTVGNKVVSVNKDDQLFIDKEMIHRISNMTDQPVEIIEVQTGDYFGEDDIERLCDKYGRP